MDDITTIQANLYDPRDLDDDEENLSLEALQEQEFAEDDDDYDDDYDDDDDYDYDDDEDFFDDDEDDFFGDDDD